MPSNNIQLKQLSTDDKTDVYDMLQRIGSNENEFQNTAYGLTFEQFQQWLVKQDNWSKGLDLPEGYVAQTIFWLYDGIVPVGIGKIRHELNDASRNKGGNIGYAIDSSHRGKGYATILLQKLIQVADDMGVEEKLLSVESYNSASKHVIEKNGGKLIKETAERFYFTIE